MKGIGLRAFRGRFGAFNVQVDDDRLLAASNHHGLDGFVGPGVQLLVRHKRRYVNEVSRSGLFDKF
jgi:hypothetical protein